MKLINKFLVLLLIGASFMQAMDAPLAPTLELKDDTLAKEDLKEKKALLYKCQFLNCTAAFTERYNLQYHIIALHTEFLDYECPICIDTRPPFATPQAIREHLIKKHPNRPDVKIPKLSEFMKIERIKAINKYMPVLEFVCQECGFSFHKKRELKTHTTKYHKIFQGINKSDSEHREQALLDTIPPAQYTIQEALATVIQPRKNPYFSVQLDDIPTYRLMFVPYEAPLQASFTKDKPENELQTKINGV